MPLTPTADIVADAAEAGVGVGSFNVIQVEHAEGIVAGAEAARAPLILQISENCVRYHGGLGAIGAAALAVARSASAPVAVHLDHATNPRLVDEALALGFGSGMFHPSAALSPEHVKATADVA